MTVVSGNARTGRTGRGALVLTALALVLCVFVQRQPARADDVSGGTVPVTVVSNGWHTGLALPISIAGRLDVAEDFPGARWIEFGFGDEAFYRDPDPGLATALRAALMDTPAVLHVFAMTKSPQQTFLKAELRTLSLTDRQARPLVDFIAASMARDGDGRPIDLGPGLYARSRFFRAIGGFTLTHTCNTWAARALAAAGLRIAADGVLTSEDLIKQLPDAKATTQQNRPP